ncbi:dimethyladenosine transferase [Thermoplasma volcanium GSS1]|uniref:Dimethyladenosine transferase n=1 Tax=Thermoplasma volcanium (strain ATCC 51530 / DSM 4299 / JCM 9571 / NBRC 15438 / GSS1) TaxID=273116 RepID=Q97BY8_THEVO|nr:rRNA adenine dimethyltransferase family protein [Thermoplasma volcanium]BAB59459.1 dimethyladenosine transferase [Thermoplasma volcanium GSS1]
MSYSKRLGQVFLRSRRIAEYEVDLLNGHPGDSVLEIGPGHGILTSILLDRGYYVTAVEKDRFVYNELLSIKNKNLNLFNMDFLDMPPQKYDFIIGNIPYYISSDVIFKLYDFEFSASVIMVQKEFADKLTNVKDSSRLYVNAYVRYEIDLKRYVGRKNFNPQPKVDSAILLLKKKKINLDIPLDYLDSKLKVMFSKKRKMISNIFEIYPESMGNRRPSDLTASEILDLVRLLHAHGL